MLRRAITGGGAHRAGAGNHEDCKRAGLGRDTAAGAARFADALYGASSRSIPWMLVASPWRCWMMWCPMSLRSIMMLLRCLCR